jgi:hypothetical protein
MLNDFIIFSNFDMNERCACGRRTYSRTYRAAEDGRVLITEFFHHCPTVKQTAFVTKEKQRCLSA